MLELVTNDWVGFMLFDMVPRQMALVEDEIYWGSFVLFAMIIKIQVRKEIVQTRIKFMLIYRILKV